MRIQYYYSTNERNVSVTKMSQQKKTVTVKNFRQQFLKILAVTKARSLKTC